MKKTVVRVVVCLDIEHPEDVDVFKVLENMDYNFTASDSDAPAEIVYTEIAEWDAIP